MASKILLADDSITIQKVVNLTFADEGIDVVAVNNGDVAERRMDEVRPDLVLADIFMPGKNGYELCEAIKNSQFRNTPVVLLVGAFEPFDQAEARRVRADAHLTKPFESRTLVETVRKLMNSTAQTAGGPVPVMSTPSNSNDDVRADDLDGHREDRDTAPIAMRPTSTATPRLDLSAMMNESSAMPSVSARTTAELSPRFNDTAAEAFDLEVAAAPVGDTVTATLIDTDEPFGTMELISSGFTAEQFSSTLGLEPTEPMMDFEKSKLFETQLSDGTLAFDTERGGVLEIDVDKSECPAKELHDLEPSALDVSVNSDWNEPALQHVESGFEVSTPVMLAAEEPLGDVLEETHTIEAATGQDPSASDGLSLDLTAGDTAMTGDVSSTAFDFVDSPEESSAVEEPVEERPAPETHPAADWTSPAAASYSTAQLDSVVMPVETAAYLASKSAEESASAEVAPEASFSTPTRWAEDEAQFIAIDVEAVPLDSPEGRAERSAASEQAYGETPMVPSTIEPTNGAPSELSAAAIEAIVRRVITEMSDSVVREVAWEVVPDCVERVVDQLTRESLSRRV
jgi:CheY-like chemotaxis protein